MTHPIFSEPQAKGEPMQLHEQKDIGRRLGKLVITALLPIPFFHNI